MHPTSATSRELPQASNSKPVIVLVHGAFADGTSWQQVIPLLEQDGYRVTAVQIPLTSLADDVATTKRVIDDQKGSIVVVGHSYGGNVITGAAAGNPQVKALVYVNAFAPDVGEKTSDLNYSEQLYVLEGEFTVWVGKNKVVLGAGKSAFIPMGTPHVVAALSDQPARGLVVAAGRSWSRRHFRVDESRSQQYHSC